MGDIFSFLALYLPKIIFQFYKWLVKNISLFANPTFEIIEIIFKLKNDWSKVFVFLPIKFEIIFKFKNWLVKIFCIFANQIW
jgi:hypothetical protein